MCVDLAILWVVKTHGKKGKTLAQDQDQDPILDRYALVQASIFARPRDLLHLFVCIAFELADILPIQRFSLPPSKCLKWVYCMLLRILVSVVPASTIALALMKQPRDCKQIIVPPQTSSQSDEDSEPPHETTSSSNKVSRSSNKRTPSGKSGSVAPIPAVTVHAFL
jgi:hypothetical protein